MSEKASHRPLNEQEIDILTQNNCSAGNWQTISVADDFRPQNVTNVHFSGNISIGSGVMIRNVSDVIANYNIGDNVVINNIGSLITAGQCSFGNGTRAAVVNENGGRSIPIFQGLSAQLAYIMAMYKHLPQMQQKLQTLVDEFVQQTTFEQGSIADGVHISGCDEIRNVNIGPWARLQGVSCLENGTILSYPDDQTFVGTNVIARDFIFAEGATVADGVMLTRCFAGQGVRLEKGFSAVDSVFFANSHFEQGEACSIFAGPFTVSHHKATLLIAGMYSFYNAGSGTNNSNHMYKLGPNHQGILERGCKSGSESYLLFPTRLGAFSTVIGKHNKKVDLTELPFSCLVERHGKSELFPALNLTNIGLIRDSLKWPNRDHRKAPVLLDHVETNVFSPYTAQKMLDGIELLTQISQKHLDSDHGVYHGIHIMVLQRGIELYQSALDAYFGKVLLHRLAAILHTWADEIENNKTRTPLQSVKQLLIREVDLGIDKWIDIAGLLTPDDTIQELLQDIEGGQVDTLKVIAERFESLFENYQEYEWAWVAHELEKRTGKIMPEWRFQEFETVLNQAVEAETNLVQLRIQDAAKEFDMSVCIGYGIDAGSAQQAADFQAVCGRLEEHKTVQQIRQALETKKQQVDEVLNALGQ